MVMFAIQHVLSHKDEPEKKVSDNGSAQDGGCIFNDLLQNILIQNLVTPDGCNAESDKCSTNSGAILSQDESVMLNTAFQHPDLMEMTVVDEENAAEIFQNNIVPDMPVEPDSLSSQHTLYSQTGEPNVRTIQSKLPAFDKVVMANQSFYPYSAGSALNKTAEIPVSEIIFPATAERMGEVLEPETVIPIELAVKTDHEIKQDKLHVAYRAESDNDNSSIIQEIKPANEQDTSGEPVQKISSVARNNDPSDPLSDAGGNATGESMSGHSEPRIEASRKDESFAQSYLMADSSSRLFDNPDSPIQIAGQNSNQEFVMQLADRINVLMTGQRSEMEVHIKPEKLGRIVLKVVLENGEMSVKITAQSQFVKDLIESNQHDLKSILAQEGYNLARLDVNIGSMYQQSQWNDYRSTTWQKSSAKKGQEVREAVQLNNSNTTSAGYYSQWGSKIDCFA